MKKHLKTVAAGAFALAMFGLTGCVSAQAVGAQKPEKPSTGNGNVPAVPSGVPLPPGYVIGPDDVLTVLFWRDKEMSTEVAVRPDGMISLLLLNDVQAAGLTPDQLREHVTRAASKYLEDPTVTVVVKEINSRKVFITGMVSKPGPYLLTGPTTVVQLIAMAGGLHEFAKDQNITILRTENGKQVPYGFNYNDVKRGRNLRQNIDLKPGDTVIVP